MKKDKKANQNYNDCQDGVVQFQWNIIIAHCDDTICRVRFQISI